MYDCPDPNFVRIVITELPASREARRFRAHARKCARCSTILEQVRQTRLIEENGAFNLHPDAEDLSFYLDTPPGDPALAAIARHLDVCDHCRDRVDAMVSGRQAAALVPARSFRCRQSRFIRVIKAVRGAVLTVPWPRTGLAFTGATAFVLLLTFGYWRYFSAGPASRPNPTVAVKPGTQPPPPHGSRTLTAAIDDGVVSLSPSGRISTSPAVASLGKLLQSAYDSPPAFLAPPLAPFSGPVRSNGSPIEGPAPILLRSEEDRVEHKPEVIFDWMPAEVKQVASYTIEVEEMSRKEPLRVQRQLKAGPITLTLSPGRTYRWCIRGKDANGLSVTSSPYGRVYVMSSFAASTIEEHPDAHLLRGLLYEQEGALDEALLEYRQLHPGQDGVRARDKLIQRVLAQKVRAARANKRTYDTQ